MQPLTGAMLAAAFDAPEPFTVGLEEEVMLLDPTTLGLAERAPEVVQRASEVVAGGPERCGRTEQDTRVAAADVVRPAFKLELPASQVEIATPPRADVPAAMRDLAGARRRLVDLAAGVARPAAAGVHPFSPVEGRLNDGPHYERTAGEYGSIARRQLVCALQVHVAIGGAERTLAVYNALRVHLPELAALAANAPVYDGRVTDLASVRPKVSELLPRQGIPPFVESWDAFAAELRWGAAVGAVPEPATWWWELRPHPRWGTLEIRVPDAQTTLADVAAVATVCHALAVALAEEGGAAAHPPTWRIEENRWSACRDGVEGTLADLETGERQPTRKRLHGLLDWIEPYADAEGLRHARALVERNGAVRQREVAAQRGPAGVARWLAERFVD